MNGASSQVTLQGQDARTTFAISVVFDRDCFDNSKDDIFEEDIIFLKLIKPVFRNVKIAA